MQNIDQNEINKFEKMASSWWDPEGECKLLHAINPIRMAYIQSCCNLKGKRVLDIGCGGGLLTEAMTDAGTIVTGIDLADASLEVAKLHQLTSGHSIDYQKISAEEMAAAHAGEFDVITCLEML